LIRFGDPDTTWRQYGLLQYPIIFSDEDSPYKAIVRKGELVKILGRGYELFPNEEALKLANQASDLVGLHPFTVSAPGLRTDGHVIFNEDETRMRAIYTLGRVEKVDGDEVNVGVNVFNSIDGSSSFGCGLFTFREICSNGVILGYEKIFQVKRIHTKGLSRVLEEMKTRMIYTMERGLDVLEGYRRMAQEKVTEKLVDRILNSRLSLKVLPNYIKEEEATLPDLNQWQLYNDITELIWHNADAGLHTKTFQFNTLHRAMPLQVRRT
jgi:hypothetical protein